MDGEFVTKYPEIANMCWKSDNLSEFALSLGFKKQLLTISMYGFKCYDLGHQRTMSDFTLLKIN